MRNLQRSVGNARLNRMLARAPESAKNEDKEPPKPPANRNRIQTLAVSHPDDPSEKEAEAVAHRVVSGPGAGGPAISRLASGAATTTARMTDEGKASAEVDKPTPAAASQPHEKPEPPVAVAQRVETGHAQASAPAAAAAISNKSAGSPISPAMRSAVEPQVGADLSSARVHRDTAANDAAKAINARAFTHGSDIFLARGESENDKHLMAHEATHVAQQAGSHSGTINRATRGAAPKPEAPVAPGVLELKGKAAFSPEEDPALEKFLEEHKGKEVEVSTHFGKMAAGKLNIKKFGANKYRAKQQALPLSHQLFKSDAASALAPSLIVGIEGTTISGFIGLAAMSKLPSPGSVAESLKGAPELFGLLGFEFTKLPKLTNNIVGGQLNLELADAGIRLSSCFDGQFSISVLNEKVSFEGFVDLNVKGLAGGHLEVKREGDGPLTGKVSVPLESSKTFKNFSGSVEVEWDGRAVTGEGKVGYKGEKLSGEVTVHLMERSKAEALEEEKKAPPKEGGVAAAGGAAAPTETKAPKKGQKVDYAVFGEGDLTFAFNDWLNGTAHVIVDSKGFVTIIGEITPQAEFPLFDGQKEFIKPLFKLEARATYGVPLLADIFIFANVGLDAFAKLGPAKFYKIIAKGHYSTDPKKNKEFSIQGSINISAAAGLRLRAEAGAGLEVLGHDIKAGAGINGIAGVKAYAEATPVLGYREKGAPGEDKKGEFFIRGDLEIAAQPFLGLSGDLFVELETPWWSPISDHKWVWPLFDKEYPIGGSLGMLASVDYVFGSGQWPAIEMKPVEFDGQKFMTDMYNDKAKPKTAEAGDKKGEWKEKNEGAKEPPKPLAGKGDAKPGKLGEQPPAKSKVQPGGPKAAEKHVDDKAKVGGKTVEEHKKEAIDKGKKGEVKDTKKDTKKGAAPAESKDKKAKDPKKEEQSEQLIKGLAALEQVTAHYAKTGAEKEEVVTGVKSVRRKFKVFKSIEVIDGGDTWDYEYVYNPKEKKKGARKKAEIPAQRYLPEGYDVRAKLYERGSGWQTTRNEFSVDETKKIKDRIESILEDKKAGDETRAANRVRALVHQEKLPDEAEFRLATNVLRPNFVDEIKYHVDHITPLAEHWKTTGYDSGDKSRWNKTTNLANLRLITEEANLKKGGEGHHYSDKPYVGKNFFSTYAEGGKKGAKTIDGQALRDKP